MPRSSKPVVLLDITLDPGASGTKGAPGAITEGGTYNNQGNYNSPIGIRIQNGALAPGSPATVIIQVSADGVVWTDYETVAGDSTPYDASTDAGATTRTIVLEKVCFVRAIAFGNTSQPVRVVVHLHAVTGL